MKTITVRYTFTTTVDVHVPTKPSRETCTDEEWEKWKITQKGEEMEFGLDGQKEWEYRVMD